MLDALIQNLVEIIDFPTIPELSASLAPTLALGFFLFCLAFYRLKIEKYQDKVPSHSKNAEPEENSCDGCEDGCKKIKKVQIVYGTETGNFSSVIYVKSLEASKVIKYVILYRNCERFCLAIG